MISDSADFIKFKIDSNINIYFGVITTTGSTGENGMVPILFTMHFNYDKTKVVIHYQYREVPDTKIIVTPDAKTNTATLQAHLPSGGTATYIRLRLFRL